MVGKYAPVVVVAVAVLAIVVWLRTDADVSLALREPGLDRTATTTTPIEPAPNPFAAVSHVAMAELTEQVAGEWPCFRGANRDGIGHATPALSRNWDAPQDIWAVDLGEGYAGAAVANGRVYLMDYDRAAQADALRCFSLATGQELWRTSYPLVVKRNHGMSRTVPTIAAGRAVTFGPLCHVMAVDSESGTWQWGLDLVRDFGVVVPPWYAGQCPLVVGDRVILGLGAEDLAIAVSLTSGDIIWRTPNPRGWQMSHATPVPMTWQGRQAVVYVASGGMACIAVDDGSLLWQTDVWKISIATVPSPIIVSENRIFLSGGYNSGCMMLDISGPVPAVAWQLPAKDFGATQQTPILYRDHIYGIRPNGELACLDLEGQLRWTSGTRRFGLGPLLIADGLLMAMDDDGHLSAFEADPTACRFIASMRILDGHEAWAPFALAGTRLLARDFTRLTCLELAP